MYESMVVEDEVLLIIRNYSPIDADEIDRRYKALFNKTPKYSDILMSIEKLKAKNIVSEEYTKGWTLYHPVLNKTPMQVGSSNPLPLNLNERTSHSNMKTIWENKELFGTISLVLTIIIILLKTYNT